MSYDFSLDKKKAILLAVVSIVLLALTFFAGLFLGAMMQQPATVTAVPNSEEPEKASAGAPAVLPAKLPAQPKIKLPPTPKVKLPAIANKAMPAAPAAALKSPTAAAPAVASATPSPAPPAASPKPVEPYPYSIRLASYNKEENALKALAREQNAGLSPYLAKVNLGGKGVWWRLFTGYYPDRAAAKAAAAEYNLKNVQIIKTPYANLIAKFSSIAETKDLFKRLDAKGYSPYVIKDANDQFRLITGAFITEQGARDQRRDLKADGIDSKIVAR